MMEGGGSSWLMKVVHGPESMKAQPIRIQYVNEPRGLQWSLVWFFKMVCGWEWSMVQKM